MGSAAYWAVTQNGGYHRAHLNVLRTTLHLGPSIHPRAAHAASQQYCPACSMGAVCTY
jgi:hypothetical protein